MCAYVSVGLPCVCMFVSWSAFCVHVCQSLGLLCACVSVGPPCVCMCVSRSDLCAQVAVGHTLCVHVCQSVCLVCACAGRPGLYVDLSVGLP